MLQRGTTIRGSEYFAVNVSLVKMPSVKLPKLPSFQYRQPVISVPQAADRRETCSRPLREQGVKITHTHTLEKKIKIRFFTGPFWGNYIN